MGDSEDRSQTSSVVDVESTMVSSTNEITEGAEKEGCAAHSEPSSSHAGQNEDSDCDGKPTVHLPVSAPLPSAVPDARSQVPSGDALIVALAHWQWIYLDGARLPAVYRSGDLFLAVHMVQLKLLSKFPPKIPHDMYHKYTMVSHKMTPMEAWVFNAVNAVMAKLELGCQLFTPNDEVVRLDDVRRFYWNVKAHNLGRIVTLYAEELKHVGHNFAFIATITQLKKAVELDLENVRSELKELCPELGEEDGDQHISVC